MTVQHKDIVDAQRHEPKGATTASVNQVLTSNGDGTTKFAQVSFANLADIPASLFSADGLSGASTSTTQDPSTPGTPIFIDFGPASATTDISLASDGTVTFNTPGTYLIQAQLNFGRDAGSSASLLYYRAVKNGSAADTPSLVKLETTTARLAVNKTLLMTVAAGDTFQMQIVNDASGDSHGGLRQSLPTATGWSLVPSASIVVGKFTNLV